MFIKARRIMAKGIDKPLSVFDWFIFFLLAMICFLCFQEPDLLHTGGSALAYLNGHILDFYEYNLKPMGGDNYLPSSYILFAIWDIPLKLFGIVSTPTMNVELIAVMWYKVLPSLFYMATAVVIYHIGTAIGFGTKKSKLCAYAFLTAPLAFFSQFIFGQYDTFMVFFMLIGIYFYFKNDMLKFVLFFGISLTFKYFPIFVFMPLLMLREKDIWKIIKRTILVMVPIGIEVAVYILSPAFRKGIFGFSATNYIIIPSISNGANFIHIVVVAWILICGWAYFKDVTETADLAKWGLFFCNLVVFLLFGLSSWHPQWLMFAVPFLLLTAFMNKKFDFLILFDVLMMFCFVFFTVNSFRNTADQSMFSLGILEKLAVRVNEFPMSTFFVPSFGSIMFSFLSGFFLVYAVFTHPKFCMDDLSESIDKHWNLVRVRFIAGVSIFVIPAFICLIASNLM
jgi:hypothetical protein